MRTNKRSILWTSILSIISLCVSILSHYYECEYVSNLFAGIFASGVLAFLIAIINYHTERQRTLEKFYSYASKATSNYNRFENEGNLERSIDSVLQMNQFDYMELDNAYGDIDFIFHNKENREYIYESIYEPTITLRKLINDKCFHFNEYRKAVNGNKQVMQSFLSEIDHAIMSRIEQEITNDDGTSTKICYCHNKIVKDLKSELTGRYYKIMYPFSQEEIDNAD